MARYIDADKLIEELKEQQTLKSPSLSRTTNEAIDLGLSLAIRKAKTTLTADVEEVKHGEWKPIVKQDDYLDPPYCDTIKCSECGEEADVSFHDAKYCYRCGAVMDGGKTE